MLIGYARVSTERQDLAAQLDELRRLGVDDGRVYTDKRTGKNKDRPGLREALAAVRAGDTLVVARLDRLARSVPDARDIVQSLYEQGAALQLGASVHDPNDPVGKFLFNALAMVAEFEHDLIVQRTKEGLAIAKANGRLKGTKPKLNERQTKKLVEEHASGKYTVAELAEDFGVSRATVYRTLKRIPGSAAAVSASHQVEHTSSPKGSSAKASASARPWFVVEASDLDDPNEAVSAVSSYASESAANNALRRQRGKSHGTGVLFAVRHASDIHRHRAWDVEQARAVIRLGPPSQ